MKEEKQLRITAKCYVKKIIEESRVDNYPDCDIPDPTFLVYPIINDEVLDIELTDDIHPYKVLIPDIEDWLKSKEPLQWLRTYQLNKLGI